MTLRSPRLTAQAGGPAEVQRSLDRIENVWLDCGGLEIHLDLHRSEDARATIVFQPGRGAHARVYFLLGALLARRGYHQSMAVAVATDALAAERARRRV